MNQIPEKLINYRIFEDGVDMIGIADVQLPSIEYMTETVKGAGIAGEVDSPTLGHFSSMGVTLNWRTVEKHLARLATPRAHMLDCRGAQQRFNNSTGELDVVPVRLIIRALPKKSDIGKFDAGATTDSTTEMEAIYIKLTVDSETVLEIDKYNYICNIGGIDFLEKVRRALGL